MTCPSPVALGTSESFPACSDIHGAHSTPCCSQQHRSLHQPQGSCLGAGVIQDVAVSCMQAHCWRHWVTAEAASNPSHGPVVPAPGSWEYIQTTTSSMHSSVFWSLCILERSCILDLSIHG